MSDLAMRLVGVGKMYKVFASASDAVLDTLRLSRIMFWHPVRYREFWALRGIDLELSRGQRLGVIGRNGAGKTTLLKVLTGNLAPTEGVLDVRGTVQPLIDVSAGFHPEFTGHENIRAALTYQGLRKDEIEAAESDIAEFTELGRFLFQPFKTYSLGMQSRLAFAVATSVKPEILIVDEVLGAGDAYFFAKSLDRMRQLVESGASVIIVSHALDHIVRFCRDAVWIERGRIVKRGPSLEVVKAYQEFIQVLEDRRLRAKNRKTRVGGYSAEQRDSYVDTLLVRVIFEGDKSASCAVDAVALVRNDQLEERIEIGNAQDADPSQSAFVVLDAGAWSSPVKSDRGLCRLLKGNGPGGSQHGDVAFALYLLFDDAAYSIDISFRRSGRGRVSVEIWRNGTLESCSELVSEEAKWESHRVSLKVAEARDHDEIEAGRFRQPRAQRHWPGEGSLTIEDVRLVGPHGEERAVVSVGEPLTLTVSYLAREGGTFDILPAATLYRLDGILVSNHVGTTRTMRLDAGQRRSARLEFDSVNLGNGVYVFSVALYRRLSHLEQSEWYDLVDRGYEFEVVGNAPFDNGIFRHPATWHLA